MIAVYLDFDLNCPKQITFIASSAIKKIDLFLFCSEIFFSIERVHVSPVIHQVEFFQAPGEQHLPLSYTSLILS